MDVLLVSGDYERKKLSDYVMEKVSDGEVCTPYTKIQYGSETWPVMCAQTPGTC